MPIYLLYIFANIECNTHYFLSYPNYLIKIQAYISKNEEKETKRDKSINEEKEKAVDRQTGERNRRKSKNIQEKIIGIKGLKKVKRRYRDE